MSGSGQVDFAGIASLALSQSRSLVPAWLPGGKVRGHEFVCGGIGGEPGESFSVNLTTGKWGEFNGLGVKGGDLVSLFAAIHRTSQIEAAKELAAELGAPVDSAPRAPAAPAEWAAIIPVPDDAPPPPSAHPKHGKPTHTAHYRTRDGGLIGIILRCEPEGSRKQVVPLTYCQNAAGTNAWRWQALPKPRSLYGAELLKHPGRILILEGEPKTDAARRMLGDAMIVVAWPGGSAAAGLADWSLLAGRDCIIWPDNDGPGKDAAAQIAIQLRHHGATARIVTPPADAPPKWDLADAEREGWSGADIMRHIDPPEPERETYRPEPQPEIEHFDFAPLGHDRGRFYFFTAGGGQVRDFSARDLQSIGSLCELAPLRYWEINYPGKGDAGFNVRGAGDSMIRACYKVGIYDAERLRGRGAWLDEGRTVLHLGDKLLVDGTEIGISSMRSRFIYEQGRQMSLSIGDEQLSSERASRLMDLCMACPWEDQASMGRLFAGWLVIAPVCGAMPWRPHIYLTGEAGSGKSWVLDNIIRPVVSYIALTVASKTSEAGIRGELGLDARPVIFDEFETQNEDDRKRIQLVLDLARQASSEDGAAIVKGTQTGGSRRYRIRSCFAFSSINLGLQQAADESRTVVLTTVLSPISEVRSTSFAALKRIHAEVMTPDFQPALLARTLALLPTIRANAEVFASAIARSGIPRRTGDTIGVLLAGAWSLRSRRVATPDEADQFLSGAEWVRSAVKRSDTDPEWRRALDFLVQVPLRTPMGNRAPMDVPIGELIAASIGTNDYHEASRIDADTTLARAGIRVLIDGREQYFIVANNSEKLRESFAKTPWSASWLSTLARSPGCAKIGPSRFAALVSRGLRIPLALVLGDLA